MQKCVLSHAPEVHVRPVHGDQAVVACSGLHYSRTLDAFDAVMLLNKCLASQLDFTQRQLLLIPHGSG